MKLKIRGPVFATLLLASFACSSPEPPQPASTPKPAVAISTPQAVVTPAAPSPVVSPTPTGPDPRQKAQALRREGESLVNAGDPKGAIPKLEEARKLQPEDPEILFWDFVAHRDGGADPKKTAALAKEVQRRLPGTPEEARASEYLAAGPRPTAQAQGGDTETLAREITELDQQSVVHGNLAQKYSDQYNGLAVDEPSDSPLHDAKREAELALEFHEKASKKRLKLARLLLEIGKREEAADVLRDLYRRDEESSTEGRQARELLISIGEPLG